MRTRPAFGRCDCARSDRGWEVAGGYTSEASHVRRSPTPDGGSLLGDVSQLCHGFFHLSPTPELASHPHELCLRLGGDKCETKGVVVVAALRDRAGDVKFLARYSNCPLSSHAEEYAIRDEELIRAVKDLAPDAAPIDAQSNPPPPGSAGTLTLYQRLQPCHGSSDNKGPRWSCSEALINGLHRELLKPRGISLRVAVSYTYRAHWDVRGFESERERRRYAPAVESAREGIRLFAEAAEYGVALNALDADDWSFLVSLCDDDVAADHASAFGYTRTAAGTSTCGSTSTSGGAAGPPRHAKVSRRPSRPRRSSEAEAEIAKFQSFFTKFFNSNTLFRPESRAALRCGRQMPAAARCRFARRNQKKKVHIRKREKKIRK